MIRIREFIVGSSLLAFVYLITANTVFASYTPNFSTCPNPNGTLLVSYDSGIHGIVGDYSTHVGSDKVYQLSDTTNTQCFCPIQGTDGIKTDWWNASGLSQDDIKAWESAGWIYVANGADWGLSDAPYLTLNSSFACNSTGENNGGSENTNPGTALCNNTKPGIPQLISINRVSLTTEILTWTSVNPVTYYSISYGTSPNNFQYGVANAGNVTNFTIGALNSNTTYYFEVRAVNGCMPGDPSNVLPINRNVLGTSTSNNSIAGTGGQLLGDSTSRLADTHSDFITLRTVVGLAVFGILFASGVKLLHAKEEN